MNFVINIKGWIVLNVVQLVADFEAAGIVDHIEKHLHQVGHSERSGAIVEPYLSKQWFVKMKPLLKLL